MSFYRNLFASLCFIFFGAALAFGHPYLYFGAMMCGVMFATARKKKWPDPVWAEPYLRKIDELLGLDKEPEDEEDGD
ncbi:MAG: hypothetical protein Q4F74_00920 [Synergistaceae bacterium]|nr:hypothetical protein [Synergistaceae bacterium]